MPGHDHAKEKLTPPTQVRPKPHGCSHDHHHYHRQPCASLTSRICLMKCRINGNGSPLNWFCLSSSYRLMLNSSNTRQRWFLNSKQSSNRTMFLASFGSYLSFSCRRRDGAVKKENASERRVRRGGGGCGSLTPLSLGQHNALTIILYHKSAQPRRDGEPPTSSKKGDSNVSYLFLFNTPFLVSHRVNLSLTLAALRRTGIHRYRQLVARGTA